MARSQTKVCGLRNLGIGRTLKNIVSLHRARDLPLRRFKFSGFHQDGVFPWAFNAARHAWSATRQLPQHGVVGSARFCNNKVALE